MGPEFLLFLCVAANLALGHRGTKASHGEEKARLPEFLTELDLASLEASEEDVEELKKIVKRLAPEKNVFFGNEDLLKEWLKGAGVMGQPGVDFPVLTTIPRTAFSCRGLKGGYYADLETNCQVFHICDNGRKISFLCPNGTIFQQSQLICDWWFKVDCGKSVELYEQSAEQLAQDERRRAEVRKMNSEFHRAAGSEDGPASHRETQNSNYDGRQNGRTNPFGQSANGPNQIQSDQQGNKSNEPFGQKYPFNTQSSGRTGTGNGDEGVVAGRTGENYNKNEESQSSNDNFNSYNGNSNDYRSGQQNQLVESQNVKGNQFGNYNQRNGKNKNPQDYYGSSADQNAQRDEKQNARSSKSRIISGNNLNSPVQRVTPLYTETTTFRTTTGNPVKEYQQLAESAAFASSRGNRYNKAYSSNQFNNFYTNRVPSTENFQQESSAALPGKEINGRPLFGAHPGIPAYPFPTFAPIYKPRTTAGTVSAYENQPQTTTQKAYLAGNNYYREDSVSQTTYSSLDTVTATAYPKISETVVPYGNSENYQQSTQNPEAYKDGSESIDPSTQRPYVNTETYRQSSVNGVTTRAFEDRKNSSEDSEIGRDYNEASGTFSTERPYLNTESYRQEAVTLSTNGDTVAQNYGEKSNSQASLVYHENTSATSSATEKSSQPEGNGQWSGPTSSTKDTLGTRQDYRANAISASTEKPFRGTQSYQESTVTSATSSPYDKSFTYRQGKIFSTLGPYVPFTKNYAYSTTTTTTTQKPPAYTATVPTYSSTGSVYRNTQNNLVARERGNYLPTTRSRATYLPEKTTETPAYLPNNLGFERRPLTEQEHAIDMLHSLQDLEGSTSLNRHNNNSNSRSGLNIPASSGPSTLHSLALYFATATDKFDSNEAEDDPAVKIESKSNVDDEPVQKDKSNADLPKTLLTEHTITSYTELFNLNNALDNSTGTENRFGESGVEDDASTENENDLDLQQSEGPLSGARKTNNTKLRELAQVFTHALSAYLQDPDTFKKVLTEIRPTEPPPSSTSDEVTETTTFYPTTSEDYSSVTKEKDEVLDFSDVTKASRRRRPTTPYPTTTQNSNLPGETTYQTSYTSTGDYYTTSSDNQYSTASPSLATDVSFEGPQNGYYGSPEEPVGNSFAFEVNHAFETSNDNNGIRNYDTGPAGPVDPTGPDGTYENYFPTGSSSSVNNRFGGFQNNSINTPEPYGKYVKPFDATPISDNYVASSTPSSYVKGSSVQENINPLSSNLPNDELTAPFYTSYDEPGNGVTPRAFDADVSNSLAAGTKSSSTTPLSRKSSQVSSGREPQRINYYETTVSPWRNKDESLITAGSLYTNYRNRYNEITTENSKATETPPISSTTLVQTGEPITSTSTAETTARPGTIVQDVPVTTMQSSGSTYSYTSQAMDDHWTSSPTVTKLWETTVYLDPNHINNGLSSDHKMDGPTLDSSATESAEYGTTPSTKDSLVTGATNGVTAQNYNNGDSSTTWKWTANSNDSPTTFTLLPTAYGKDVTGTPTPTYTTHSSITTTITSSVSSTNSVPQDSSAPSALPSRFNENAFNVTENEIIKAQEMFGNLNASSSNTLMRIMKQAENNSTVRQLVLLLINHCIGPTNKTTEEEKERLLNALLRMPVNEFSQGESTEILHGLNRLNLPAGRSRVSMRSNTKSRGRTSSRTSTTTTTSGTPPITTFRSKARRRFKSTTESPAILSRRSDDGYSGEAKNSLPLVSESASDNRALELLRSLYAIAAKWG
ncbi:uncharacterized threonine-rich GPI-anchored glycoprotein PJ4664.02 isoform X2 [Cephus cinctus]|uniref:Uncharacterized threonine-rich GPI-anchored glycoprotein PJ4664.02 isoform X2 n=1 Tax=Cephus cinctus TaxID=211228 RepID=A0AAJ7VX17_CEPCN|nr:uncharacterized threonine-rich GPI-anchored glycoprotein PJ4664.02 isoform X2 [Cephus cinctus]